MYLFFTEFSTHIPLFHRPTWNIESTHSILVKAMRACGALFTKTSTATNFIISTLTSARDMLLLEFVCFDDFIRQVSSFVSHSFYPFQLKPSCTLKDHICLMLAVVLLQSIGLLQPQAEQRSSRVYHDLLVAVCLVPFLYLCSNN